MRNRIFKQSDSDGEFNSKVVRRANQNGGLIETIDQPSKIVTNQHIAFKELGRARQGRNIVSGMLMIMNMGSYLDYLFGRFSQNERMASKRLGAVLAQDGDQRDASRKIGLKPVTCCQPNNIRICFQIF